MNCTKLYVAIDCEMKIFLIDKEIWEKRKNFPRFGVAWFLNV